jgi:uncharacterized protein YwlG (UPF0340 family)
MSEQETTEVTRTVEQATTETRQEAGITPAVAGGEDLGKVRDLVLKAHPDVVPDLITGNSVDELIASVEPARSAYQRIADQVRGSAAETTVTAESGATVNAEGPTTVVVQPPQVPAGGATNVVEPADLAPANKIARALAERKRK